jgi:hypothetical protein
MWTQCGCIRPNSSRIAQDIRIAELLVAQQASRSRALLDSPELFQDVHIVVRREQTGHKAQMYRN